MDKGAKDKLARSPGENGGGVRRWRELVIGTNIEVLFDRPKPTAGCSANERRRRKRRRSNSFTSLLLDVLCRSTSFGCLHAHHQEHATALATSGFTLERGGNSFVSRGLAGRPDHD
jgi:hypothetical protein